MGLLQKKIFNITSENDFNAAALEVFHFQLEHNKIYRDFARRIGVRTETISHYTEIPFLPIEFYKTQNIVSFDEEPVSFFSSSGTTGNATSKHFIKDFGIYEESFNKGFEYFWGNPNQYAIIALLPNYLEQQNSSLVYMISGLLKQSKFKKSGFYKKADRALIELIEQLNGEEKPILLFGVTYSLLDLIEQHTFQLKNAIVFETGGMKGRRKEMVREELHDLLCRGLGVDQIASEYGMTELFSQAYSKGDGIFQTPPWMKIHIRDVNDPFSFLENGKTGGISVIDLANLYSCSFISTQDLGVKTNDTNFRVLGRFDNSDIRGCNLLYN